MLCKSNASIRALHTPLLWILLLGGAFSSAVFATNSLLNCLRPLALLVAWLRQGVDRRDIVNARHHKFGVLVTHEDRKKARQALKEFDGIDAFLEQERDPWSEEEGSEPEGEP